MDTPRKIILWSLIIIGIFAVFRTTLIFSSASDDPQEKITFETGEIKISGHKLFVELATSEKQRGRGLSYRQEIKSDAGMLFIFDRAGKPGFWMREMNFPLDIIWLDTNRNVVFLNKNISPNTYPQIFQSPLPIKYVLEMKAGEIDNLKIKIGSHLGFKHFGFLWF
ncbi:MAG: DUF192 domain-containing protein [Candidatus Paceibacterota bacterium]|jgi:hypothetical protein